MIRVDGPASERPDGILDETCLVQRVRVDVDLHIVLIGNLQRIVYNSW